MSMQVLLLDRKMKKQNQMELLELKKLYMMKIHCMKGNSKMVSHMDGAVKFSLMVNVSLAGEKMAVFMVM